MTSPPQVRVPVSTFLAPAMAEGRGAEFVENLITRSYAADFAGSQKWLQEEQLHPIINFMVNLWDHLPPEKQYRRDRPHEESFIHELRVLHSVHNAHETPESERTISALVAGGHDLFENARDHFQVQLPFIEIAQMLWPESKDHAVISRAWELVTDPDRDTLAKEGANRIERQQRIAQSLKIEGTSGILAGRAKVADKSDNFVTLLKDIADGYLAPQPKEAEWLYNRTIANMIVVENLVVVLPREQIDRALTHGRKLTGILNPTKPFIAPTPMADRIKNLLRHAMGHR